MLTLTKLGLTAGVWTGQLTGVVGTTPPALVMTHGDDPLDAPTVRQADDDTWLVEVRIPADRLSDGTQTFVISTKDDPESLASIAFLCGDALSDDIRAEVDLLRGELDMLKRAFRRHCVEMSERS